MVRQLHHSSTSGSWTWRGRVQGHAHPTSRPPSLEFLGGPVVKDSCFHCRGHKFDPRLGTSDPSEVWPKIFFGKRNTLMILPSRLSEGQLRGRVGGGGLCGGTWAFQVQPLQSTQRTDLYWAGDMGSRSKVGQPILTGFSRLAR